MQRLTSLDGLNAGDAVRVNATCRIPECRGRTGTVQGMYAPQPEFGNPAEFLVDVDFILRPLRRDEFDVPAAP
ncbi:hypothetical protein J2Y00_003656 [Deinococcus soli (ex Cha et al. 2016)]|uniref:Uncharacterized protein n=1 Tax=Deinococcus soli (ex Cha et al. 2016) TaxID=1309411 RepID=A0AAE3XH08_9DEIO|nr:hypothetical protein [Deinococcus soli (ex Cha et al. 2016)]MDR6220045.1 hypothetical protein [Deinococcus soli (ex Cha et al. 2016)]